MDKLLARAAIASAAMLLPTLGISGPTGNEPRAVSAFNSSQGDADAQTQESWREALSRSELPGTGCFHTEYPSTRWIREECLATPEMPIRPPLREGVVQTVGNRIDDVAEVTGQMTKTVGSFPKVKGVTSEVGANGPNDYSLQINSNYLPKSPACSGHSGCMAWQQFVYASTGPAMAYMQYWLLNYGSGCEDLNAGWHQSGSSCYKNSAYAVPAPATTSITQLSQLKLTASAAANGKDTLIFSNGTQSKAMGADTVLDLATAGWNESEFNVFGDHNSSAATFNVGSSITVKIEVDNGTTNAPTCVTPSATVNPGTTGETSNLNLNVGSCATSGGATPSITFSESNAGPILTANPSWVVAGATVTFSVAIPSNGSLKIPTGSADIVDDTGSTVCTITLNTLATGTCSTVYSSSAAHTYTAAYSGDANFARASSPPIATSPYTASRINNFLPTGVNSSGDVGGANLKTYTAALDQSGKEISLKTLALPSGYTSTITNGEPVAISEAGLIAEYACNTSSCSGFLLTPTTPNSTTFSETPISTVLPTGVNSSGDVVGDESSSDTAVLDQAGTLISLKTLGLPAGYSSTITNGELVAISEYGMIAEYACNTANACAGFLLTPTTANSTAFSETQINNFLPSGVNSSGDVAGGDLTTDTAALYHEGQIISLATLGLPTGYTSTITNSEPVAISESGSIAEYACSTGAKRKCAGFVLKAPYRPQFPLVASISGLSGTLTLQNNGASQTLITGNNSGPQIIVFPALPIGSPYQVTVAAQPGTQTCTVANGSGIQGGSLIANVSIGCQ